MRVNPGFGGGVGAGGLGGGLHRGALCPLHMAESQWEDVTSQHSTITHCYSDAVNDHSAILGRAGMRRGSAFSRLFLAGV